MSKAITIATPQSWNELVSRVRRAAADRGIQAKQKTFQKVTSATFGYPHENAVYSNLPLEVSVDDYAGSRLSQLLAVQVQQLLSPDSAAAVLSEALSSFSSSQAGAS